MAQPPPDPLAEVLLGKWNQARELLSVALDERVTVDEKLKRFGDLAGEPLNEDDDRRVDLASPEFARREFSRMWPLDLYFRPDVWNLEKLPKKGGALLVSNHVILAIDSMLFCKQVFEKAARMVHPTVDKLFIRLPWLRPWALQMGCVAGTRENALALLKAGELVLSYPGGAREALKNTREPYKLQWERATGFVRVALEAQVPIVPVASVGGDESYTILAEDNGWLKQMAGGALKYTMPLYLGLGPFPLPVKFIFAVGDPIHVDLPPEAAGDEGAVREIHERVEHDLSRLLDETRMRRGVSPFG